MQCSEIINLLEELAPLGAAAAWDNSGVQVIGGKSNIKRLAVALDPSVDTISRAIAFDADFILCHHPLLFEPSYLSKDNIFTQIVRMLMSKDIWLYSAHTSLDGQPDGPVRWLADDLKFTNTIILEAADNEPYGFGFCGTIPERKKFDDFIRLLSGKLGCSRINFCGPKPEFIYKVACCPGSGAGMWPEALSLGADVLITGDLKYHTALDAKVCILDVGHFTLEEEMMRRFADVLQQKLGEVDVKFFESSDPIGLLTLA